MGWLTAESLIQKSRIYGWTLSKNSLQIPRGVVVDASDDAWPKERRGSFQIPL